MSNRFLKKNNRILWVPYKGTWVISTLYSNTHISTNNPWVLQEKKYFSIVENAAGPVTTGARISITYIQDTLFKILPQKTTQTHGRCFIRAEWILQLQRYLITSHWLYGRIEHLSGERWDMSQVRMSWIMQQGITKM